MSKTHWAHLSQQLACPSFLLLALVAALNGCSASGSKAEIFYGDKTEKIRYARIWVRPTDYGLKIETDGCDYVVFALTVLEPISEGSEYLAWLRRWRAGEIWYVRIPQSWERSQRSWNLSCIENAALAKISKRIQYVRIGNSDQKFEFLDSNHQILLAVERPSRN